MNYLYYPGCSLKSSGRSYEESLLTVFKKLNASLEEIEDWNCCGATNYMSINECSAIGLGARNLALAEKQGGKDIIAPCAACYMGLLKTQNYISTEPNVRETVNNNLKKSGLEYSGKVKVRHPLDVMINDIGLKNIEGAVSKSLKGVKVACYYGCQLIRPYSEFDDQRDPQSMEQLVKSIGGTSVDWPIKTRCCSGSMTSTISEIGLRMNFLLLKEAKQRGANVMITACPLCQFNLEVFQSKISSKYGEDVKIPVMYFTQLIGLALGLNEKELGLQRSLSPSLSLS